MRTLKCDPTVEVKGQVMMSFLKNLNADEIHPYLVKYELTDLTPEAWYPAQRFLDVLNDLATCGNLIAIGLAVVSHMVLPPELDNVPLPAIIFRLN